jgi:hypothetical protein
VKAFHFFDFAARGLLRLLFLAAVALNGQVSSLVALR